MRASIHAKLARKSAKALLVALSLTPLTGCIATTYVSSIGSRMEFGDIGSNPAELPAKVAIYDAPASIDNGGPCGYFCPYGLLNADETRKQLIGNFDYLRAPTINAISKNQVEVSSPKGNYIFDRKNFHISRNYRRWYSYPAQLLQVVALPIDAIIVSGFIISAPVVYMVGAAKHAK